MFFLARRKELDLYSGLVFNAAPSFGVDLLILLLLSRINRKLKYQTDKLLRLASSSNSNGDSVSAGGGDGDDDDPLSFRPRPDKMAPWGEDPTTAEGTTPMFFWDYSWFLYSRHTDACTNHNFLSNMVLSVCCWRCSSHVLIVFCSVCRYVHHRRRSFCCSRRKHRLVCCAVESVAAAARMRSVLGRCLFSLLQKKCGHWLC